MIVSYDLMEIKISN